MSKGKANLNQTVTGNIGQDYNMEIESNNKGAKSQIDIKNLEIFEFKVILIGESGVGKTSIMLKFITNEFKATCQSTLGIEFKVKDVIVDNTAGAKLRIWDTCGQERFRAITRQYFKNSDGVLLVFDLTSQDTVKKLNNWLNDVSEHVNEDCVIFVVGNKMDVKTRDISISELAKGFANDKKLNYYEVSARTGNGITNLFEKLAKKLVNNVKNKRNKDEGNIKNLTRNINIDDYSNRDRGKVEKNRNKFHCC
jgi:small GTP-binding protein